MKEICAIVGNRDIEPFIPVLVSCIARPAEVPDCVHKLGATTFVQNVEAPALSIMVPLLIRGLRERATAVKRKSALIIDNMAKLVDNPSDAAVFLPRLLPGLEKVSQEVPDPECRSVASKARDTLLKLVQDPAAAAPAEAHDFKVCFLLCIRQLLLVLSLLCQLLSSFAECRSACGALCTPIRAVPCMPSLAVCGRTKTASWSCRVLCCCLIMSCPLQVVLPVLKDIEAKHSKASLGSVSSSITTVTLEYVAAMCSTLIQVKNFDIEDWETVRLSCPCRPSAAALANLQ